MVRLSRIIIAGALGIAISASSLVSVADASPSGTTLMSSYTVRSGDYLSGIAFKLNINLKDLLSANDMTTSSLILPGQVLKVPVKGAKSSSQGSSTKAPAPTTQTAATYTVVTGDYLTGIAQKLGVTTRSLLAANDLHLNSIIHPGMRLVVPKGGTLPSPAAAPTSTSSTAPATTAPAAAKPARPKAAYTVVSGDFLSGIAAKLGVTLPALLSANKLTVTSLIHPGMRLVVPKGGTLPAAAPAPTSTSSTTPTAAPAPLPGSGKVPTALGPVVAFARAQLGKPYKRFAVGPDSYDCSGLTMAAYATIGIDLPHYSGAQIAFGTAVDWTKQPIKAGDLIFLETAPGSGVIGHVGMATSATTWIQAPRTGDVVREGAFNTTRIVGVRRLVNG